MRFLALAFVLLAALLPDCLACMLCRMEGGACASGPAACCEERPGSDSPVDADGDGADEAGAAPEQAPCCCPDRCSGPTVAVPTREGQTGVPDRDDLAASAASDAINALDAPAAAALPRYAASPPRSAGPARTPLRI